MARTAKNPMLDTLALVRANPEKFGFTTPEQVQAFADAIVETSVSDIVSRKFDGSQTDAEVEWVVAAFQILSEIMSLRCKKSGTTGLRRMGLMTEFGKGQFILDVTATDSGSDDD